LDLSRPPPPEISLFVMVGLKSITRTLESLSQKSRASQRPGCSSNEAAQDPKSGIETQKSDAIHVCLPESEVKSGLLDITEEPLNNASRYAQPQAFEAQKEKSAASQSSSYAPSEDKIESLNDSEKHAIENTQYPISKQEIENGLDCQDPLSQDSRSKSEKTEAPEQPLVEDGPVDHVFSAIFVPRSSQPPILHSHLPQLVATASAANPELPATRLVQLPKGCEARLSEALRLPRVSFIGLLDGAPHSKSLVDTVREGVPVIEIPWLEEAKKSVYLPLKINAIESFVPVAKK
jgi:hypothetical protein